MLFTAANSHLDFAVIAWIERISATHWLADLSHAVITGIHTVIGKSSVSNSKATKWWYHEITIRKVRLLRQNVVAAGVFCKTCHSVFHLDPQLTRCSA
jgi:hypothetical protein